MSIEQNTGFDEELAKKERLQRNNRIFFGGWAARHTKTIPGTSLAEPHPAQELDHIKSKAKQPSAERSRQDLCNLIEILFRQNFDDEDKVNPFIHALERPYQYDSNGQQQFVEVVAEDYLAEGKSIAAIMWHADAGLSDVPRFTALTRLALLNRYEDAFLNSVGEVASKTVAFEDLMGWPIDDLLITLGDVYYTSPQTDSADEVRQTVGLSEEEHGELSEYINTRSGKTILDDVRAAKKGLEPGHVIVFSPAGTQAKTIRNIKTGEITSITTRGVREGTGRIIGHFDAVWPVGIKDEQIELGPIIDLPEIDLSGVPKDQVKKRRILTQWQFTEDAMELSGQLLDAILKKPGLSKYVRTTQRGELFRQHSKQQHVELGKIATANSSV